jgi:hypothetical protein
LPQTSLPETGGFAEWKRTTLRQLRDKSFRALPEEIPPAKVLEQTKERLKAGLQAGGKFALVETEPGIQLRLEHRGKNDSSGWRNLLILDEAAHQETWQGFGPALEQGELFLLAPRGRLDTAWTAKYPILLRPDLPSFPYVERALALVGRTADEGRLYDVLAVARMLAAPQQAKTKLRVFGRGQAGILAAYAALFEPAVQEVIVLDPPQSHKQGPIFLNVLRILDIPEALGLLAPATHLTLINVRGTGFERTERLYRLAAAADRLLRK